MNRVVVAGSRHITDYSVVEAAILESGFQIDEIVNGCARGPDFFGGLFAKKNGIPTKEFPANWALYQLSAGHIRNEQMAKYATHLILVWDGKSRGSRSMLSLARQYGLTIFEKVV